MNQDAGNGDGTERAGHSHGHGGGEGNGHTHGFIDPSIATTSRGLWAVKWSFLGLMATMLLQLGVVAVSGSVALFADSVHNFGDAATAIPLGLAFWMMRLRPRPRFSYGYGRAEDLAGLAVVGLILISAIVAGWESVQRLMHPQAVGHLGAVGVAAVIGFLGNEVVAVFRIRVGREIDSAALVADGYHARVDGLASLAVLVGAIGVWLGFPLADPIVGLAITLVILGIAWQSGRMVLERMMDGVDPAVLQELQHLAGHVSGVEDVTDVRARWIGHQLHAEINVAVAGSLAVADGHAIAKEVHHRLQHGVPSLRRVVVHVDPSLEAGEHHHGGQEHEHDGLAVHAHPW